MPYSKFTRSRRAREEARLSVKRETDLHRALSEATASIHDVQHRAAALRYIEPLMGSFGESVEDRLIQASLSRITGSEISEPAFEPTLQPVDQNRFEVVAHAWIEWARGNVETMSFHHSRALGGAIHMLPLEQWELAVRALMAGQEAAAERYFKRAIELGELYETESHRAIQWTYAASFFHRPTSEG